MTSKGFTEILKEQLNYVHTVIVNKIIREYGILNSYIIFKSLIKIIEKTDWHTKLATEDKESMNRLVDDIVNKSPIIEIQVPKDGKDNKEYGP